MWARCVRLLLTAVMLLPGYLAAGGAAGSVAGRSRKGRLARPTESSLPEALLPSLLASRHVPNTDVLIFVVVWS